MCNQTVKAKVDLDSLLSKQLDDLARRLREREAMARQELSRYDDSTQILAVRQLARQGILYPSDEQILRQIREA